MKHEMVWKGLRVSVPVGWEARPEHHALSLFPSECRTLIEGRDPADAVYLRVVEGRGEDLDAVVATEMGRRVKQGEPQSRATLFAGVPALEHVWSDGVARIVSWFFVHHEVIYEVQWIEPWIRIVGHEGMAATGKAMCEHGIVLF